MFTTRLIPNVPVWSPSTSGMPVPEMFTTNTPWPASQPENDGEVQSPSSPAITRWFGRAFDGVTLGAVVSEEARCTVIVSIHLVWSVWWLSDVLANVMSASNESRAFSVGPMAAVKETQNALVTCVPLEPPVQTSCGSAPASIPARGTASRARAAIVAMRRATVDVDISGASTRTRGTADLSRPGRIGNPAILCLYAARHPEQTWRRSGTPGRRRNPMSNSLRSHLTTVLVSGITALAVAGAPAIARTAGSMVRAGDADTVNGFGAVGCHATIANRSGNLVATCADTGRLPNNIIAKAPDS